MGAAVVLRVIFTFVVVALMAIPYLKFAGGLLLFWIGYKLMQPEPRASEVERLLEPDGGRAHRAHRRVVMSLNNVMRGRRRRRGLPAGEGVLIGLGLLISIPLVVFGAAILIKLIGRFPIIVTLGAALIGWVGGEVIVTDPAWVTWVDEHAHWLHWGGPLIGAILVIAIGKLLARPHEPAKLEDLEEKKKQGSAR